MTLEELRDTINSILFIDCFAEDDEGTPNEFCTCSLEYKDGSSWTLYTTYYEDEEKWRVVLDMDTEDNESGLCLRAAYSQEDVEQKYDGDTRKLSLAIAGWLKKALSERGYDFAAFELGEIL